MNIYRDLSFAEYRNLPGINWSLLKHARQSWAAFIHAAEHEQPSSRAFVLGRALHTALLECDRLADEYVIVRDRRTREAREAAESKTLITEAEWANVCGMQTAISLNSTAHYLIFQALKAGDTEISVSWEDRASSGVLFQGKSRLDAICPVLDAIIEVKTANSVAAHDFAKACGMYCYHGQAAYYRRACLQLAEAGEWDFRPTRHLIIAVESSPPYHCRVFELDEQSITAAWAEQSRLIDEYCNCLRAERWPGYKDGITKLEVPAWALVTEER